MSAIIRNHNYDHHHHHQFMILQWKQQTNQTSVELLTCWCMMCYRVHHTMRLYVCGKLSTLAVSGCTQTHHRIIVITGARVKLQQPRMTTTTALMQRSILIAEFWVCVTIYSVYKVLHCNKLVYKTFYWKGVYSENVEQLVWKWQ